MNISPPVRPRSAINRLLEVLTPAAIPCTIQPRRKVELKQNEKANVYLFLSGELSILRAPDNLVLATVYEPHIFGIAEIFQAQRKHLLRPEIPSLILKTSAEKAKEIFRENNVWEEVTELIAYYAIYQGYRDNLLLQQRNHSIICNYLFEIMSLPEDVRRKVTILRYIQDRTYLSRSSILNTLAKLKSEGYIDFNRGGVQLHIKSLPKVP